MSPGQIAPPPFNVMICVKTINMYYFCCILCMYTEANNICINVCPHMTLTMNHIFTLDEIPVLLRLARVFYVRCALLQHEARVFPLQRSRFCEIRYFNLFTNTSWQNKFGGRKTSADFIRLPTSKLLTGGSRIPYSYHGYTNQDVRRLARYNVLKYSMVRAYSHQKRTSFPSRFVRARAFTPKAEKRWTPHEY